MARGTLDFAPFTNGLIIPDTSAESPLGSLTIATNVDVTDIGAIRQRFGMGVATTGVSASGSAYQYFFVHNGTTPQLVLMLADGSGRFYTGGVSSPSSGSTFSGGPTSAAGSAQMLRSLSGVSNTYVASPGNVLYRYDGAAFTSVASSPKCRYLTQGGKAERMYASGFTAGTNGPGGVNAGTSTLWFSDAANPESWPAANYQDFYPGDGEDIQGICFYNDQIFVFKKSRFFIIYGETTYNGATTLNWREVSGAGLSQPGAYTVTPVGIFFLASDGVYVTEGTNPEKISRNIDGLFTGKLPSWTPYNRLYPPPVNPSPTFAATDDKLHMALGNVSDGGAYTNIILTYDWSQKAWGYYTMPLGIYSLVAFPWSGQSHPVIAGVCSKTTVRHPFILHPSLRVDDAATSTFIPVDFQLNWFQAQLDKGNGVVNSDNASIARLDVWGRGHMQVGTAVDFNLSPQGWKDLPFAAMSTGDVWDTGSVWGDGSDPDDVWGGGGSTSDLLRLGNPDHKFVASLVGRGRYLAPRFNKMPDADYVYLERPRATLFGAS